MTGLSRTLIRPARRGRVTARAPDPAVLAVSPVASCQRAYLLARFLSQGWGTLAKRARGDHLSWELRRLSPPSGRLGTRQARRVGVVRSSARRDRGLVTRRLAGGVPSGLVSR